MSGELLTRPVRVLLLDNAWPYDTSANLLRLHVLRLLLRRLQVKDDGDTIAGLFQAFDLIVARDSPFMRQFFRILNSFEPDASWSDKFYPVTDAVFEIDGDQQFQGFQWEAHRGRPPLLSYIFWTHDRRLRSLFYFLFPTSKGVYQ